jgi:surface antigen
LVISEDALVAGSLKTGQDKKLTRRRAMRGAVLKGVILIALAAILTTGCATVQSNPKTTIGAVGGGALGGLIAGAAGGNPATIAASTIGGILLGGVVGNLLDQRDKRLADEAAQKALETAPTGRSVAWRNPDNEHSGTVTPVRTYQTAGGTYCREPDGSWRVVNK